MKNHESPPAKPSIEEALKLELKAPPPHLRYGFLGNGDTLPVIIASEFGESTKNVQNSYWVDYCGHYWDPSWYLLS